MTIMRLTKFIVVCGLTVLSVIAQTQEQSSSAMTTAEVVRHLVQRNQERALQLKHFSGMRHYQIDYHGFPSNMSAAMTVLAIYDAPGKKQFKVISQSGSAMLRDNVLHKLLKSEKEASDETNREHTLLNLDNYNFKLVGTEYLTGRNSYVLEVTPKVNSKFLYRGKIWVDAADFAVAKIQAHPAVNPSFWTRQSDIDHTYAKVGEFWLPVRNKTVSRIMLGGTATLTIDYTSYDIAAGQSPTQASRPVANSPGIQTGP